MFNLKDDPKEQRNLIAKAEAQDKVVHMRQLLAAHLRRYCSQLEKDGILISQEAPRGPQDVSKWPGFHSTVVPTDVLH